MRLHRKIIAQAHIAVLEFWTSFLIFLILLSGTLFLWLISFGGGTHEANEVSVALLVGGVGFDVLIFWLLYTIAASRRKTIQALTDIERSLTQQYRAEVKTIDHAKNEFVALVSHQLRTPLSTINWYAELLRDDTAERLQVRQRKYVSQITESCERMIRLVNEILNVSQIELGTFRIESRACDLSLIFKDIVSENAALISEKKLRIKKDIPRSAALLSADRKLLTIVLENIISNAARYTPKNGTIAIAARLDKKNIIISVADTGCGIPAQQQKKIFTKLFRADNIRATDTTGSGLGLHIAKSILDHIDGRVWFESKENHGSTFFISLPKRGTKHRTGVNIIS